jgi:hypothetical protein
MMWQRKVKELMARKHKNKQHCSRHNDLPWLNCPEQQQQQQQQQQHH